MTTIGTHNLHDHDGVPTFFADAIGFTEAVAHRIRSRKRARWAKARARLAGYTIRVCSHQRDLVMALRRRHYKVLGTSYEPVHGGRAKVTPHRGTFVVRTQRRTGRLRRARGRREVFLLAHRVNAAFPPFKRGEAEDRQDWWAKHERTDANLAAQYVAAGWVVHNLGDLNTPHGVRGTRLPHEAGVGFDRIGSTVRLRDRQYLSRKGSDHPRLRATID